jgi:tRNA (cmo5U34)-methyltransferase
MVAGIPRYQHLQATLALATGAIAAGSVLDLGAGTGETLARVLERHPAARAVALDESPRMLQVARTRLAAHDVTFVVADLLDPLPAGPFDLIVSALAIHHLEAAGKATLFGRIAAALVPGGRFVLGDVVVPAGVPASAAVELTEGFDKPSTVAEQVGWLLDAGFAVSVVWEEGDLALLVADLGPD